MYLKAHRSLSPKGLVVRLWVYEANYGSSNSPRAAYCYSICNKVLKVFSRKHQKFWIFDNYKKLFLFGKLYFFLRSACF